MAYVPLSGGLMVQILSDVTKLPSCQKHHYAAFIQESALLVVWDDEPKQLLSRAEKFEKALMQMVWEADQVGEKEKGAISNVVEVPVDEDGNYAPEAAMKPRKLVLCYHRAVPSLARSGRISPAARPTGC